MSFENLTWHEYLKECHDFLRIAEHLGDNWSMYQKNDNEGNSFLLYKQKLVYNFIKDKEKYEKNMLGHSENEMCAAAAAVHPPIPAQTILQIEYHIVYSISYQVPVLYFQAHKHDGSLLNLEEAWNIFYYYNERNSSVKTTRADMLTTLTQMEHPVLFKPFLVLHPCRTSELLAQAGASRNRVLTFISLMGPFVQLQLSNEYGLEYNF